MKLTPMLIEVHYKPISIFQKQAIVQRIHVLQPLPFDNEKNCYYTLKPLERFYAGKHISTLQIGFQTDATPDDYTVALDCLQQPLTYLTYDSTQRLWFEHATISFCPGQQQAHCELTAAEYLVPIVQHNTTAHMTKFAPIICQHPLLAGATHDIMAINLYHMYRGTLYDDTQFNKNLCETIATFVQEGHIPTEQDKAFLHTIKPYIDKLTTPHLLESQLQTIDAAKKAFLQKHAALTSICEEDVKQQQLFFQQFRKAHEKHVNYLANLLASEQQQERPPLTDELRDVQLSFQLNAPVTNWTFYKTERGFLRVSMAPSTVKNWQQPDFTLHACSYPYAREVFNMYDYNKFRTETMHVKKDDLLKPFQLSFTELSLAHYAQLFSAFNTRHTEPAILTIKGKAKAVQRNSNAQNPFESTNKSSYTFSFTQLSSILLNGQPIEAQIKSLAQLLYAPQISSYKVGDETYAEADVLDKLYDYSTKRQRLRFDKQADALRKGHEKLRTCRAQIDTLLAMQSSEQATSHFEQYTKLAQLEPLYTRLFEPRNAYVVHTAWVYFTVIKQLERFGWHVADDYHYKKLLRHVLEQTTLPPVHLTLKKAHYTARLDYTPPEWKETGDQSATYQMTITNSQTAQQKVIHLIQTHQAFTKHPLNEVEDIIAQLFNDRHGNDLTCLLIHEATAENLQHYHEALAAKAQTIGIVPFAPTNVESFSRFLRMVMETHFDSDDICWNCGHEQRAKRFIITNEQQAVTHLRCRKCLDHTIKSTCKNGHVLLRQPNGFYASSDKANICPACSN